MSRRLTICGTLKNEIRSYFLEVASSGQTVDDRGPRCQQQDCLLL